MLKSALRLLHCNNAELSVLLVGDEDIKEINRQYRGMDKPTDVIAFAMRDGEFANVNSEILGDIVVSLDRAKVQARERGVDVDREVKFLLIHGVLHLLGYDHEKSDEDRIRMEKKEEVIVSFLGL